MGAGGSGGRIEDQQTGTLFRFGQVLLGACGRRLRGRRRRRRRVIGTRRDDEERHNPNQHSDSKAVRAHLMSIPPTDVRRYGGHRGGAYRV